MKNFSSAIIHIFSTPCAVDALCTFVKDWLTSYGRFCVLFVIGKQIVTLCSRFFLTHCSRYVIYNTVLFCNAALSSHSPLTKELNSSRNCPAHTRIVRARGKSIDSELQTLLYVLYRCINCEEARTRECVIKQIRLANKFLIFAHSFRGLFHPRRRSIAHASGGLRVRVCIGDDSGEEHWVANSEIAPVKTNRREQGGCADPKW